MIELYQSGTVFGGVALQILLFFLVPHIASKIYDEHGHRDVKMREEDSFLGRVKRDTFLMWTCLAAFLSIPLRLFFSVPAMNLPLEDGMYLMMIYDTIAIGSAVGVYFLCRGYLGMGIRGVKSIFIKDAAYKEKKRLKNEQEVLDNVEALQEYAQRTQKKINGYDKVKDEKTISTLEKYRDSALDTAEARLMTLQAEDLSEHYAELRKLKGLKKDG